MSYIDGELATCLSIAISGINDAQAKIDKVERVDLTDATEKVQNFTIGAAVFESNLEPYAVIYQEDVWYAGNILSADEADVIKKAMDMIIHPEKYAERDQLMLMTISLILIVTGFFINLNKKQLQLVQHQFV